MILHGKVNENGVLKAKLPKNLHGKKVIVSIIPQYKEDLSKTSISEGCLDRDSINQSKKAFRRKKLI